MNKTASSSNTLTPRFLRSMNLASDWNHSDRLLNYLITPNVIQAIYKVKGGLLGDEGQKALTLAGPYGAGKSSFLVFLCQLLTNPAGRSDALNQLALVDKKLAKSLSDTMPKNAKGFFPIPITARRQALSLVLLEGLTQAASLLEREAPEVAPLLERMRVAIDTQHWRDSSIVVNFFLELGDLAQKLKYRGLIIMVDEIGKTLEYALQDKDNGDIYILQEIAELANRSSYFPILFITSLHQMLDDYVELASRIVRAEWAKVQERFQPIQFVESVSSTILLIAEAINGRGLKKDSLDKDIDTEVTRLLNSGISLPPTLSAGGFRVAAHKSWPLHPTTLLLAPYLFKRLAQNERSIFTYLNSLEPHGFQHQCDNMPDGYFIRPHHLYSYFVNNFEAHLSRTPYGKGLLEANDILKAKSNLPPLEDAIIKTVAVFNILGRISPILATKMMLACAVSGPDSNMELSLDDLVRKSILTFRRLSKSYQIWEGSDVDIEARLSEARRQLKSGSGMLSHLHDYLPRLKLVARRHSHETGAYRYFSIKYLDHLPKDETRYFDEEEAGKIFVVLRPGDSRGLEKLAKQLTLNNPRVIVAVPGQDGLLFSVLEEVADLKWVEKNTAELRDDRIAKRELHLRLAEAEHLLRQCLKTLLEPRPVPIGSACKWFWQGEDRRLKSMTEVTKLLSQACDEIYSQGAQVRNELIARHQISAAAAAARRNLVELMLTQSETEDLGMTLYPPERSIYASMLKASGIHRPDPEGSKWVIGPPPTTNALSYAWSLIEKQIFEGEIEAMPLPQIYQALSAPPFGIPRGMQPLLLIAFYLANQDEVFLYREGSFLPAPQMAHFELLLRRPELFAISGAKVEGARQAMIARLANGLNTAPKIAAVVRELFRMIYALPEISKKTVRLNSPSALKLRERFFSTNAPEEFLFTTLPQALGCEPIGRQKIASPKELEALFDKLNECLQILATFSNNELVRLRNILLKACGHTESLDGWLELEKKARVLAPKIHHDVLSPFLTSIINGENDGHNPIASVSFVLNTSFLQCSDKSAAQFESRAQGFGELFGKYWHDFGDDESKFSSAQLKDIEKIKKRFDADFEKIKNSAPPLIIKAMLKDWLKALGD